MHIQHVDIFNFRRLKAVHLPFHEGTTVLVGGNNSGKTAAVQALGLFLPKVYGQNGNKVRLSLSDIHTSGWEVIDRIGRDWAQSSLQSGVPTEQLQRDLTKIQAILPAMDLYLRVAESELHRVGHLIPDLDWSPDRPLRIRIQVEIAGADAEQHGGAPAMSPLDTGVVGDGGAGVRALAKLAQVWQKSVPVPPTGSSSQGRAGASEGSAGTSEGSSIDRWPTSLSDFLEREMADSFGERLPTNTIRFRLAHYTLSPPADNSVPEWETVGDLPPLRGGALDALIGVDVIGAQRGLGAEEQAAGIGGSANRVSRGALSGELSRFFSGQLIGVAGASDQRGALLSVAAASETMLNKELEGLLRPALERVRELGYPTERDPEIQLRSRIKAADLLNHETAVRYSAGGTRDSALPEHAIGLGYQNLMWMAFQLAMLGARRMAGTPNAESKVKADETSDRLPIHVVLIEEPEAHLHAQVQRVFIDQVRSLLRPKGGLPTELTTQLVVTTHSTHIAHAVEFNQLRYFRRSERVVDAAMRTSHTDVVDLSRVFGDEVDTERFVRRYLQLQHSDLFFAEAAILVEGLAESLLVPYFIGTLADPPAESTPMVALKGRYLTVLPIGGAHAHRLLPLIERLGLPTLVITDLDPKFADDTPAADKKEQGKAMYRQGAGQKTSNASIKNWYGTEALDEILREPTEPRVRPCENWEDAEVFMAHQMPAGPDKPESGETRVEVASTFEDALILENRDWFRSFWEEGTKPGSDNYLAKVGELIAKKGESLHQHLLKGLSSDRLGKGELATAVLFGAMGAEGDSNLRLKAPTYMVKGLEWLQTHLSSRRGPISEKGVNG